MEFEGMHNPKELQILVVHFSMGVTIIEAMASSSTTDILGRKASIMLVDVLFVCGSILAVISTFPELFLVGQALMEVVLGLTTIVGPLLVSEASPTRIRAGLITLNGAIITIDLLFSYMFNPFSRIVGWHVIISTVTVLACL
jgi:SP family myo-inositol transporter-like MFS transporter 13